MIVANNDDLPVTTEELRKDPSKLARTWRWGTNRWFVIAFIVMGFFAARAYPPILPHIQLPAEELTAQPLFSGPRIGDFYLTNTLVATFLADIILILIALAVRRTVSGTQLIPKGIAGAIEAILEAINNLTESTAGKWARGIFPFFATIFMLVLIVNWMELIPGVDSIGILHHDDHGYPIKEVIPGVFTIYEPVTGREGSVDSMEETVSEANAQDGTHEAAAEGYIVTPFVRVASTDLNFTVALALISIFMTQVFGVRALGPSYFTKFINVGGLFKRPVFGAIDFGVGLLELISEISKILSFSFRLFGNIFAGTVLLFVIGTLVPVFAQSLFLGLEFAVGLIQALVFGMLTMVFMAQATQGHGSEEHHDRGDAHVLEHDEHQHEMPIPEASL
jgi:F-type H+-transporting ATPase subunit a